MSRRTPNPQRHRDPDAAGPDEDEIRRRLRDAEAVARRGHAEVAVRFCEKAFRRARSGFGPYHTVYVTVLRVLAGVYLEAGWERRAVQCRIEAVERAERLAGRDDPLFRDVLSEAVNTAYALGRWREAVPLCEDYVDLLEGTDAPADELRRARAKRAFATLKAGQFEEAAARYEEMFDFVEEEGLELQPRRCVQRAHALMDCGRFDEAERQLDLADRLRAADPPSGEDRAWALYHRSVLCFRSGRYGEGGFYRDRAVDAIREAHPDDAGKRGVALDRLKRNYLDVDLAAAATLVPSGRHDILEAKGPDSFRFRQALETEARLLEAIGKWDAAEEAWERVLSIRRERRPPGHAEVLDAVEHLQAVRNARRDEEERDRERGWSMEDFFD